MIRVLIVEDSKVVRSYLSYLLSSDPDIEVFGEVSNGKKAIEFIEKHGKPDIITMDIDMPVMDGIEATRIIMSTSPVPIIVVTASRNAKELKYSMDVLAAGALTVIEKPVGLGHSDEIKGRATLIRYVKIFSEIKVVKRKQANQNNQLKPIKSYRDNIIPDSKLFDKKFVAIGVSTGGPQVLKKILSNLSSSFPYPILVVQHITVGFLEGMVQWLNSQTKISIKVAKDGESLKPGTVYFAPDSKQMGYKNHRIELVKCNNKNYNECPSVSYLFNSMELYAGRAIAILLTGMGKDGANELKTLYDNGTLTIVQDKKSSLVHGMPGEAINLGVKKYIYSSDEISELLEHIDKYSMVLNQK